MIPQHLLNLYNTDKTILPSKDMVLRAIELCPKEKTKVIIIGQDPYASKEHANGLAFSTNSEKLPPSLKNIFKELYNDLGRKLVVYPSGDLSRWAESGVLLLNRVLTVVEGKSGSHANLGWEEWTRDYIQEVINQSTPLVIICWGKKAKNVLTELKLHDKILILTGGHPSPLNLLGGFFGGKYFSKANEWLRKHHLKGIGWL